MSFGSTGWPNSQAWPSLAGSRPVSIFMVVDLPQPFETEEAKNLAARNTEINMVNRDELTEAHGQIFRLNGNLFLLSVIRRGSPPAYAPGAALLATGR
ncbi:Uncharacterised protein [Salmonella enterica subsp. enterica]|nr:Uncharacterised protein [Salmonella enterica subsp. enterica]